MKKVIKIDEITIKNLKNVSNGTIKFSKSQRECEKANIVGLYGQNASGKTAIVDAFKVLDRILHDTSLNDGNEELINVDKNCDDTITRSSIKPIDERGTIAVSIDKQITINQLEDYV